MFKAGAPRILTDGRRTARVSVALGPPPVYVRESDLGGGRRRIVRRATKTAYFLNRAINRLALIGAGVRFPDTEGFWMLVADAVRAPWEVIELLCLSYPEVMKEGPASIALLTEYDVRQFEREIRGQR